ncbi:cache domain-containing protein [Arcobacter sp. s6]|uniref:sensor histidine kinase n=1 Tax=Arcobacter sp. s6 TaxID=3230363 RepID=UPI0034A034B1
MYLANEKKLLFIIRYLLSIIILLLSISLTTFLYFENKSAFEKIKQETEVKFISEKKQLIKEQIDNIYDYVIDEQNSTEENLKKSLKTKIYDIHKVIINIYNQYKDIYSKEEITLLIKTIIKDMKFNDNRGYFFIYDKDGKNIFHGLNVELEDENLIKHRDSQGVYTLKESLDSLKNSDESYQIWYWKKTQSDDHEYKKIGFIKNINELDWFIGTGEYIEDFKKNTQAEVIKQISKFSFGENSYIIVTDKNNNYISHINKDLIGKNAFEKIKAIDENNNLKAISKVINESQGYVFLDFYKPNTTDIKSKIIYLRTIPNWDWVISTGFYKDDIDVLINKEKEILTLAYEKNVKELFLGSLLSTFILLGISFYISFIIEKKLNTYKANIKSYMDENQKQYELLAQKTKLVAMGQMLENIAHQWRQPLSLITILTSGIKIKKELDVLEDDFLLSSLTNIENSAYHLSETIEDFRDFFRPDKEKSLFSMNSALDKTFKLLQIQLDNKQIKVIRNIDDLSINGFEREFLQVLLNIFKNAMDALELVPSEKYIFIDIHQINSNLIIKIKDNAGGIKEDIIKRVFEPYFTTKHQSQGTGIGLYMSEEIITKHMDGELNVQNTDFEFEGKRFTGAMFIITLPMNI